MQENQKIGQYEILEICGNDMAIVKDTMFETPDVYIMAMSEQLRLLNIKNYDLIGFPGLINQFEWEGKACFIYKEFEGTHLDTIPYDIDFSVNVVRNLCLSIYQVWRLSGGCFCPQISMDELYLTKDKSLIFQNAYVFSSYQKCEESFLTKQLSYILYQMVTGRKQLDDIRSIDPSFSYILNSTILKCAREETLLGLEAFATTLDQYKETDLMVYQQDRSLRPSRRKKNTLNRFMPDPKRLDFHVIRPEENKDKSANIITRAEKDIMDASDQTVITKVRDEKERVVHKREAVLRKENKVAETNYDEKLSDVQQSLEESDAGITKRTSLKPISKQFETKSIQKVKNSNDHTLDHTLRDQNDTEQRDSVINFNRPNTKERPDIRPHLDQNQKNSVKKETLKTDISKKEQSEHRISKPQSLKRKQKKLHGKGSWDYTKLGREKNCEKEEIKKKGTDFHKTRHAEVQEANPIERNQYSQKLAVKEEEKQDREEKENKAAEDLGSQYQAQAHEREIMITTKSKRTAQKETTSQNIIEDIERDIISEDKTKFSLLGSLTEKSGQEDQIKEVMKVHENQANNVTHAKLTDPIIQLKQEENIPKRRLKEKKFKTLNVSKGVRIAMIGSFLLVVSIGGFFIHKTYQQNKYNDMIEVVDRSTDQKEKIRILHQAINLLPKESKAYERLLEVYLEDAVFSSSEERSYLKMIHQNWDKVKNGDGYGNLAYEIGKAYWYYYEYDNMNNEEITRMKSAVQWFEDSLKYKSTENHHKIAKIYCEIGRFNQEITLNVKEGTDKGVYKKYYNNLNDLLKIGNTNTVASLELYKLTVNSIDTYKERFMDDGVSEEDINQTKQDVLYKVNETSVVTEKEKELKNAILYGNK